MCGIEHGSLAWKLNAEPFTFSQLATQYLVVHKAMYSAGPLISF